MPDAETHPRELVRPIRRAVTAQPPPKQLAARIVVGADQLAGLEPAEVVGELARGRIAIARVARHRAADDREEVARDARRARVERRRAVALDRLEDLRG